MRRNVLTLIGSALGLTGLPSCKSNAPETDRATRDSAGIAIIENSPPANDTVPWYRLDSLPVVEIGGGSDSTIWLADPRAPVRLSDGRIVVIDNPKQNEVQIRIFSRTGKPIGNIGRTGDGPGEYRYPEIVGVFPNDSILVYDASHRVFTVYDSDGKHRRSVRWTPPMLMEAEVTSDQLWAGTGGGTSPIGVITGQRILAITGSRTPNPPGNGVYRLRDTVILFTQRLGDSTVEQLARVPNNETLVELAGSSASAAAPPFRAASSVGIFDTLVVFADNTHFDLTVIRPDGKQVRRIRRRVPRIPVTARAIDLASPDPGSMVRRGPMPDSMPAFDHFKISSIGELWVREYDPPGSEPTVSRYAIFDTGGRWVGHVVLPLNFEPSWIGADAILGLWTDQDGVPRVREYRLVKRS